MFYAGCNGNGETQSEHHPEITQTTVEPQNSIREPDAETKEMIRIVQQANSKVNPANISYYLNDVRSREIKKYMDRAQGGEKIRFNVLYADELLKAGKTQLAIDQLIPIVDKIKGTSLNVDSETRHRLFKLLAIAYMRKGEQENCLINHTSESCLMPIQGKGIHQLQSGSRSAIELYQLVLTENKDDLQALWLLNLAYMTLGEYPDRVPAKWLIPPDAFVSKEAQSKFSDVSVGAGVDHTGLSGGCNVDDFNNDGLLDIIASSWGFYDQLKYFVNLGNGKFSDETASAGLTGITGGLNIIHADYNNDGFVDVLILRGAWLREEGKMPNSLLKNNGDGTFSDVTKSAGLLSFYPTQTAVWSDFNNDGWLDIFIGNESNQNDRFPLELYMSNRDGTFTNMAAAAGLSNIFGFTKGVAAGDINNDGWPEIYLSFLHSKNVLLLNNGAKDAASLRFSNITQKAGVGEPEKSFPTWFFDYNNDGLEDIFVSGYGTGEQPLAAEVATNYLGNFIGGNPRLYRNIGNMRFVDDSKKAGLEEALFTMGCNFGDIDNDGFQDFYLGTGNPEYSSIVPNKMFRNHNGERFVDVTSAGGLGHIQKGHGVGFGDLDNDGDQDFYAVMGGAFEGDVFQNALFENPDGNRNNWITIRFEGVTANRYAIGARLKLTTSDDEGKEQIIYQTVSTGGSFGCSSLQQEIGLGKATLIKELKITWPNPDQTIQILKDIPVNQFVKVTEENDVLEKIDVKTFQFNTSHEGHHHPAG